jgi:hypothetical protein
LHWPHSKSFFWRYLRRTSKPPFTDKTPDIQIDILTPEEFEERIEHTPRDEKESIVLLDLKTFEAWDTTKSVNVSVQSTLYLFLTSSSRAPRHKN